MERELGIRRRGRPPSPRGVARNHRIVTFVNDEQFAYLHQLSEATNTSLSTTLYQLLCQSLTESENQNTTNKFNQESENE